MRTIINKLIFIAAFLFCTSASAVSHITSIENAGGKTWMCVSENGTLRISFLDKKGLVEAFRVQPKELESVSFGQLWNAPDGKLYLYYTETDGYYDGRGELKALVCLDPQNTTDEWYSATGLGVGICTGKPVLTNDGKWLVPAALWGRTLIGDRDDFYGNEVHGRYDEGKHRDLDWRRGPLVYVSADNGLTWSMKSGLVVVPEKVSARHNDPQIVKCSDGSLKMIIRSSGTAWTYSSVSNNNGRFWSSAEKFVQSPDRKAAFHRLSDGKLLMVKLGRLDSFNYLLGKGLYAYLSDTDGETWYGGLCIDSSADADSPVVTQNGDGTILIAYDKTSSGISLAKVTTDEIINSMVDPTLVASDVKNIVNYVAPKQKSVAKKKDWTSHSLRVCSYNIQYKNDNLCKWSDRLEALEGFFNEYKPDLVGSQEPYIAQIDDMIQKLGEEYSWFGINTYDQWQPPYKASAGFNPIFYRKDRLEVLKWDVIWYTPVAAERGYGADYPRFLTWAKMKDLKTGKEFFVFNSHFDHKSMEAREISAGILVDAVARIAGDAPAILTGDFNSTETSAPYAKILESGTLANSKLAVKDPLNYLYYSQARYKSITTVSQKDVHIDHIFYTPASSRIESWELVIKTYGGFYGSDHLPIVVDWRL